MKTRKALTHTFLVAFVLAVVGLFVFGTFLSKSKVYGECLVKQQDCKDSVRSSASLHFRGLRPSAIDCEPNTVEISKDRISKNSGCSVQTLDNSNREERIKKAVADEMYYCWDQFLQGKENLFGDPGIYCNLCSIIEFRDAEKAKVKGLSDFIARQNIPNGEMTYYQFLTNGADPEAFEAEMSKSYPDKLSQEEIAGNKLMVVFVYAKSEDFVKKLSAYAFGTDIGGGVVKESGKNLGVALGARIAAAAGVRGASAAFGFLGGVPAVVTQAGFFAGGVAINTFLGQDPADWASFVTVREYSADQLNALGCSEITSKLSR